MEEYVNINHTFEPVYDKNTRILILGTFPSVKSREYGFYYGHPQNRFWRVLSGITDSQLPVSIQEKKEFLLNVYYYIYDNTTILNKSDIRAIFANGNKAYDLYEKYVFETVGIKAVKLPSTSPANARWNLEKLETAYSEMLKYIAD